MPSSAGYWASCLTACASNIKSPLDDEQHYQKMLNDQKADFRALGAKRDQYNTMTTALNKTEELL